MQLYAIKCNYVCAIKINAICLGKRPDPYNCIATPWKSDGRSTKCKACDLNSERDRDPEDLKFILEVMSPC